MVTNRRGIVSRFQNAQREVNPLAGILSALINSIIIRVRVALVKASPRAEELTALEKFVKG